MSRRPTAYRSYTSLLFPGVAFFVFFMLNLVMWAQKSSAAVPFVTLIALLVLWFGTPVFLLLSVQRTIHMC